MNNSNNSLSKARDIPSENDAGVTQTPNAAADDLKHHVEAAVLWREHLILHLQNSLRPGGTPLRLIEGLLPDSAEADRNRRALPRITRALLDVLPSAEIVLWRPDLMLCAESQADYYADFRVVGADLPRKHEFWCFYGHEIASRGLNGTHKLFLQILLSGGTIGRPFASLAAFYFPYEGSTVLLDKPPLVRLVPPLTVGHPPPGIEAQMLLACLTFRAQPFIEDARADVHYSRAERRQMEREGRTPPSVRVLNLRRKERKAKEDADGQHPTRSPLSVQFFVSPHLRKPNSRMKEQRPIWVGPYIKGPKDKPLKPPTRNIIVVKR